MPSLLVVVVQVRPFKKMDFWEEFGKQVSKGLEEKKDKKSVPETRNSFWNKVSKILEIVNKEENIK